MKLILDTKTESPFGWFASETWDCRFDFAQEHADIIAVHSMPEFGGGYNFVQRACKESKKPILVKGIHRCDDEIKKFIDWVASHVLVVGRVPEISAEYLNKCLLEPTCIKEILDHPCGSKVVWNQRNLVTGLPKVEKFEDALKVCDGWICQASMIKNTADIHPLADAIMVGEYMEEIVEEIALGRDVLR